MEACALLQAPGTGGCRLLVERVTYTPVRLCFEESCTRILVLCVLSVPLLFRVISICDLLTETTFTQSVRQAFYCLQEVPRIPKESGKFLGIDISYCIAARYN